MSGSTFTWSIWNKLSAILTPFAYLTLIIRCFKGKEVKSRLSERFASYSGKFESDLPLIILRAPSVGETKLALFLIEELSKKGKFNFLICSNTKDSANLMKEFRRENIKHCFTPLDISWIIQKFLKYWQPSLIIHIENEIWPISLLESHRYNIPTILINGRISDRSWKRYSYLNKLFTPIFSSFDLIHPRSKIDSNRISQLSQSKILEPSNLKKFSFSVPNHVPKLLGELEHKTVFLAASTHEGEEELIMEAVNGSKDDILCIIVPRHPSRGPDIAKRLKLKILSNGDQISSKDRFFVVDKINILNSLYPSVDFVFLGNSLLSPGGGHNFYEPLHFKKPVCLGPFVQNWTECEEYLDKGVTLVSTTTELTAWINSSKVTPSEIKSDKLDKLTEDMLKEVYKGFHAH